MMMNAKGEDKQLIYRCFIINTEMKWCLSRVAFCLPNNCVRAWCLLPYDSDDYRVCKTSKV